MTILTEPTELTDPLVGTTIAERYFLKKLLGAGAMGAVYQAEHIHMHKLVALKVLHREMSANPEVVKRFEREAIAAGRVEHPHVATAQDFGQLPDGSFFLVLEYIRGRSLREVLEQEGALGLERSLVLVEQIARALLSAHDAGVIHRDLKPENVMLVEDAREGDFVKVLDFGLAKIGQENARDTKLTRMGAVYGTPQYMAPEQAAGREVDGRADLYALGVIFYELLTGRAPFESDQIMALLVQHMTEAPPPLPAELPQEVRDLVARLLAKEPEQRFESAEELVRTLEELRGVDRNLRSSRASWGELRSSERAPLSRALKEESQLALLGRKWKEQALVGGRRVLQELRVPVVLRGPAFLQGKKVPRGVFLLPLLVLPLFFLGRGESSDQSELTSTSSLAPSAALPRGEESPAPPPQVVDPELAKVIEAAKLGSDPALYALEQRADAERSASEWQALIYAHLLRRDAEAAVDAWKRGLTRVPTLATDGQLLGILRHLADDERWAQTILPFAAEQLGEMGADFLFHVWAKTSLKTTATSLAYELLESAPVKKNWSHGLRVALELRGAETCEELLQVLSQVELYGDDRSLVPLRELEKTRGCGPQKREDCYPCLRSGGELKSALSQALLRNSPRFELPRRFKFKR